MPMDDWFKTTFQQLQAARAALDLSVNAAMEQLVEQGDRLTAQIDQTVGPALDELARWEQDLSRQVEDWVAEVPTEAFDALEQRMEQWADDAVQSTAIALRPLEQTVKPMLNQHPPCVGCRNYHGETYGHGGPDDPENMLVCAMHPFGYEGEACPDWQSVWRSPNP